MRLFVGLAIPDLAAEGLMLLQGGVPGARWVTREQLHLTLRFIGEVDGRRLSDIEDALGSMPARGFAIELHGLGTFGSREPRQLWAGVRPNEALMHLQRKIETALQRIGLPAEPRKFTPHVTIAKLKAARRDRLMEFIQAHALYASAPFEVNAFLLYRSTLTPNGSLYTVERDYPLDRSQNL
jgi:2'-5' RNA ligase